MVGMGTWAENALSLYSLFNQSEEGYTYSSKTQGRAHSNHPPTKYHYSRAHYWLEINLLQHIEVNVD